MAAEPPSQERLDRLAGEVAHRVRPQESSSTSSVTDSLPFLDDLIDESGELNLPLGLTVYDTMGTTSVGIGSEF
ncbi:MAG: hypothetical protein WBG38_03880 [Nodosilinea sp.]